MKRVVIGGLAAGVLAVGGAGAAYFEPWTLWTRSTLIEAAPTVAPTPTPTPTPTPANTSPTETEPAIEVEAPKPVELAAGDFVTQEHRTSGAARVIELPDGSRVLRVEGFSTSNGPDLEVWLSEASAGGDWFKYADARAVPLGKLKATDGDHNYTIPAGADLDGIDSAVIWCVRFDVAFGSAPLDL